MSLCLLTEHKEATREYKRPRQTRNAQTKPGNRNETTDARSNYFAESIIGRRQTKITGSIDNETRNEIRK
jgi:hypothetical protein